MEEAASTVDELPAVRGLSADIFLKFFHARRSFLGKKRGKSDRTDQGCKKAPLWKKTCGKPVDIVDNLAESVDLSAVCSGKIVDNSVDTVEKGAGFPQAAEKVRSRRS